MRKFLVISFSSGQKYTGGMQCSKRNLESIREIFGEANVINYTIKPYTNINHFKTKIKRIFDIFRGYMGGLDSNKVKDITKIIESENITDLFIDSSLLGLTAKLIKKRFPNIQIYTFFHNSEIGFIKDSIKANKDILHLYWLPLAFINEKASTKYSDKIICLNERDASEIKRYYKRDPDQIIPITLKSIQINPYNTPSSNNEALFIGSYFFGNIQGIRWFCKDILPNTNIHLTIVGASMDNLKKEFNGNNQISIYSDVPDLSPYLHNADFVILPIISGSGMKVKTAESLMYGKYIIGTDEAFRGYEITDEIGKRCNNAKEFIEILNNLSLETKFNYPSRKLFEDKYSFESSLNVFKNVFNR